MSSWRYGFLFGLLVVFAPALPAREAAPPDKKAAPGDVPPLMPPAGVKADPWKIPGGALLEITPEKYQELLDEIARLKANAAKPAPPTSCRLTKGRIEGGFALFTAQFGFRADRADALFALACGQAKASAAQQQDGRTPILTSDANGYQVQVDKPGDYVVTLELSVPLAQRAGGGFGLELDLPRAVLTELEMDFPPDARALRLNGKDVAETSLTFKNGQLKGWLGAEPQLILSWRGAPPAGVAPLLTVRGRVVVHVEAAWVNTQAELTLHTSGGPVGQWVLDVPTGTELKLPAADQVRGQINRAEDSGGLRYTVLLKEPSEDDLTLTATVRTPLPAGKRASIGPFLVRRAGRQSGVLLVSLPAAEARLILYPRPELTQRELTEEERRTDPSVTAAYDYVAGSAKTPWLEVEAGSAHEPVKVRTAYAFILTRAGADGPLEWQASLTVSAVSALRAGADHVDVQLPAECELVDSAGSTATFEKATRIARLPFEFDSGGASAAACKVRYRLPPPEMTRGPVSLTLPLPRPLQVTEGGARIDVAVPDDLEVLPTAEAEMKEPHKLSWRFPQSPEQISFSVQPFRPEIYVSSLTDVTYHGSTVQVKQELHLRFPRRAPKQLTLHAPAFVASAIQAPEGGTLAPMTPESTEKRTLLLQGTGQEQTVVLQYSFAAGAAPLPLVTVAEATGGETKVRVWCEAGPLPVAPDGAWLDQNIEEVAGVNRLPVLVLKATRPDAPLTLRFGDPSGQAATVLVDRVLIRATLAGESWTIRASYLLRQLGDSKLDVQLPGPPSALQLHAALDGRQVDWQAVEDAEPSDSRAHTVRLRLASDLVKRPTILDIEYQLSPGRGAGGVFQTALTPPRLVGDPGQAPTRWAVTLPSGWLALSPEAGAAASWTVGFRDFLLKPQVAITSADLERWFAGSEVAARGPTAAAPNVVCWTGADDPLLVAKVWQPFWLLLCSLTFMALGLRLFVLGRQAYAGRRRAAFWFWLTAVVLIITFAIAWVLRPTLLYAFAYGCEPGVAVLLILLVIQWLMLERYRRQIVFLPNFRRARTGSSLLRVNGLDRPTGEPSTVDVPRPTGSSQKHV